MPKASFENSINGNNIGGLRGSPAITRKGNAAAGIGYLGIPARVRTLADSTRKDFQTKNALTPGFQPKLGRRGQSTLLRGLIGQEDAILATASAKINIQQSQPFNPAIQ